MTDLLNQALVNGTFNAVDDVFMETELTIQMVEMELEKSANHEYWGSGPLTYTITITNNEAEPYTDITLTDTLDFTKVSFVTGSVYIGTTPVDPSDYSYEPTTGVLTVTVGTVPASSSVEVSFRVTKI